MAMAPCLAVLNSTVMNGVTPWTMDSEGTTLTAMNGMAMNGAMAPRPMDSEHSMTPHSLATAPWPMHSERATSTAMNSCSFKRWVNLKNGQEFVYDSHRYLMPRDEGPL